MLPPGACTCNPRGEPAQLYETEPGECQFSLRLLLGDGLLTMDGEFHRQQRRLVQPAFHKHRIETYAETMAQLTQEELATWQPYQEIKYKIYGI